MTFKGAPYPIRKDPRGFFRTQTSLDQIKSDLLILLLTNPGERCLTGDTLIPLANGTEHTIADLVGKDPFWVYSYDHELDKIVPGLATAHQTEKNAKLMKITLDNGESVRCTPSHLWMLRNGEYKRADELVENESLMPLYRKLSTSKYERIYQPYLGDYRETHLCFVEGTRLQGEREVVHHVDLDKRNNAPDNLQWMTCKDHKNLHKEIRSKFDEKLRNDPEFYNVWISSVRKGLKKYYETHDGNRKGVILNEDTKQKLKMARNAYYSTPEGKEFIKAQKEKMIKKTKEEGNFFLGKTHSEESKNKMRGPRPAMSGENNPSKREDVKQKLREAWVKRKLKNHKVAKIEILEEREDCYDLSVEKYHNFGLSSGVFVHNCMLPEFGTPLRSLVFEPNDVVLANRAKQMIIDSINAWEPRITIEAIEVSSSIDEASLNPDDLKEDLENILSIKILFYDPENIQNVQALKLDIPLSGGSNG